MKVLNLRCTHDHAFEGWFASEAAFLDQAERGVVQCPLCGDAGVTRLPSAPRLNLSGARAPAQAAERASPVAVPAAQPQPATLQAMWLQAVAQVVKNTEDVGERFPEEARRMHYGEVAQRGIRGQATVQQRAELADEGIEVMQLPLPEAHKGTAH